MSSFLRPWFRRKFGPYMKNLTVEETQKYLLILRIAYFFGTTSLCYMGYLWKKKYDEQLEQLSGEPPKKFFTDRRSSNRIPSGIMYEYVPGKGMMKIYFDKDEYYKHMEEVAYQEAKEAQQKALAEGQKLPEKAINLVES